MIVDDANPSLRLLLVLGRKSYAPKSRQANNYDDTLRIESPYLFIRKVALPSKTASDERGKQHIPSTRGHAALAGRRARRQAILTPKAELEIMVLVIPTRDFRDKAITRQD